MCSEFCPHGLLWVSLSALCLPDLTVQHQMRLDVWGFRIVVKEILCTRCPLQQSLSFQCLHKMLSDQDRLGTPVGVSTLSPFNKLPAGAV